MLKWKKATTYYAIICSSFLNFSYFIFKYKIYQFQNNFL